MEKTTPLESSKVLDKIAHGEVKVKKSIIQAEGKAHQTEDKKIKVSEKTYEAIEKKAKAEGKKVEEKVAEIVEQKTKPKTEFKGKVNKYGFLHIEKELYQSLNWKKGEDIAVKISRIANGFQVERA